MDNLNIDAKRFHTIEKLKYKQLPVLNDGFVALVDVMGDDRAITEAARISYGGDERGSSNYTIEQVDNLIRYMMSGGYNCKTPHTSPFEMVEIKFLVRVPMDIWRQWIRHRTACLSGDTKLVFNRPCDNKAYRLTVKEVYDKFQPTVNNNRPDKQGNAYFKRDKVQNMSLRSMNEETGEVYETSIVDIWESGIKKVFKITIKTSHKKREIKVSEDHLFFTPNGWKKLKDLNIGDEVYCISSRRGSLKPTFNKINQDLEEWKPIIDWEDYYEISSQGRVRRIVGGKGSGSYGDYKKIVVSNDRAVTSLNRPGEQRVILIHREMLKAFSETEEDQCRHLNGNSLDNRIENLKWGTSQDNSNDMIVHGNSTYLTSQPTKIISKELVGEEVTYDLEVSGPYNNFSANDFVVHNSVNEYSTRYSEAIDSKAITKPDKWRLQSKSNKQGSEDYLVEHKEDGFPPISGYDLSIREDALHQLSKEVYQERLDAGVAREQARKDLPLSTYTEAYWKIDLHNLFHFLKLRLDSHAQLEIRQYANVIYDIVKALFPLACAAFEDYIMDTVVLSRRDIKVLNDLLGDNPMFIKNYVSTSQDNTGMTNNREREACMNKLIKIGLV